MEFLNLCCIVLEYINSIKHCTFMVCFVCSVFTLLLSVTHQGWQTVLHHFGSHITVLVIGRSVCRLHYRWMRWWFLYCKKTKNIKPQSFLFHSLFSSAISAFSIHIFLTTVLVSSQWSALKSPPEWWSIKRQSHIFLSLFNRLPSPGPGKPWYVQVLALAWVLTPDESGNLILWL